MVMKTERVFERKMSTTLMFSGLWMDNSWVRLKGKVLMVETGKSTEEEGCKSVVY